MKIRLLAALAFVGAFICLAGGPASAVSGGTLTAVNFQCDHVTITYDAGTFDRDNTNKQQEAYSLVIQDGNGQTLFTTTQTPTTGTTFAGSTQVYTYNAAPSANPISVRLTSLAGNGLPEQLVWNVAGSPTCTAPTSTTTTTTTAPLDSTTTTVGATTIPTSIPTVTTTPGATIPPPTVFVTTTSTTVESTTTVEATSTTTPADDGSTTTIPAVVVPDQPTTTAIGGVLPEAGSNSPATAPSAAGNSLARTGVELAPIALVGLLLAATGTVLLLVRYRQV